jgi:hypothetical protein
VAFLLSNCEKCGLNASRLTESAKPDDGLPPRDEQFPVLSISYGRQNIFSKGNQDIESALKNAHLLDLT